jgi:hypothetical protein
LPFALADGNNIFSESGFSPKITNWAKAHYNNNFIHPSAKADGNRNSGISKLN